MDTPNTSASKQKYIHIDRTNGKTRQAWPNRNAANELADLEESHDTAGLDSAVLDLGLLGQVGDGFDGRVDLLHRQEGRQVGRVGRDEDESEEPPRTRQDPPCDIQYTVYCLKVLLPQIMS